MKLIAQSQKHGYGQKVLAHYCPACETMHGFAYITPQKNGAIWTFDGDFEQPTFTPSMHIKAGPWPEDCREKGNEYDVCHYFLTNGVINYLTDCTHKYAGQQILLTDVPAKYLSSVDPIMVPPNPRP